jgi:hypothetical protein
MSGNMTKTRYEIIDDALNRIGDGRVLEGMM